MSKQARFFAKETFVYSTQPFLTKIIAIFLVPIYTAYLTPTEFGQFSFIFTIGSFISPLLSLGLTTSFWKYWTTSEVKRPQVLYWVITLKLAAGTLLTSLIAILYGIATSFNLEAVATIAYVAGLTAGTIFTTAQLYFRATHRSATYLITTILYSLVLVILNILFIVIFRLSYFGVILGSLSTSILFGIVSFYMINSHIARGISKRLPICMLSYGFPMIFSTFAGVVLVQSDRIMLRFFASFAEVGSYSYAYRFGGVFYGFLLAPFFLSWNPLRWEIYKRKDAKEVFSRISKIFIRFVPAFSLLSSGILILVARVVTMSSEYFPSLYVVPLIALSYAFYGLYYFEIMGLLFVNKTKYIATISLIAALMNIILNIILIPTWGYRGAAIATLLSYLLLRYLAVYGSQKYYPIERNIRIEIYSVHLSYVVIVVAYIVYNANLFMFAVSLIAYGLVYISISIREIINMLKLLK